mgnify:CR=1 FL=1
MYLYIEATRDCPLNFDGNEVIRVDFKLPNNRKSDTNLSIKVFGDLLEHPSPVCIRQQVATINCKFYEDRDDCESQEAMYAYQSLNRDSSLLLCTLGVDLDCTNSVMFLQNIYTIITGTYKQYFYTDFVPVVAIYMDKEAFLKFRTLNTHKHIKMYEKSGLVIMYN